MRAFKSMLRWCVACGALLLAVACDRQEQLNREMRENLTTGYWQAGTDDSQLVRFTTSGEVFYFRCAPVAGSSSIDACYDAAAQPHTGYAVDFLSNTPCLLPDDWFNILHLTEDALTLQADGGEPVFYVKVSASRVTVLPEEEFLEKHPAES